MFPEAESAIVRKLSDLLSAGNGGNVLCLTAIQMGSAEALLVLCVIRDVTGMFLGSSYSFVSCYERNTYVALLLSFSFGLLFLFFFAP